MVSCVDSHVIVGVASHDVHEHDSKTLKAALASAQSTRDKPIELAVVDRGYRGGEETYPTPHGPLATEPTVKKRQCLSASEETHTLSQAGSH